MCMWDCEWERRIVALDKHALALRRKEYGRDSKSCTGCNGGR